MRVYFTTQDNGDGSSTVIFFDSQECIDYLETGSPEAYGAGEGGSYFDVEGTITGIQINTMKEIREYDKDCL